MRCFGGFTRFNATCAVIIGIVVQQKFSLASDCPCDIYAAGGQQCVAAYSTVRALYSSYSGSLYQVRRKDGQLKDIGVLTGGGIVNAATQDSFLKNTTGTISKIYDQSGKGNDLTKAPGGSAVYGPNDCIEADANALPIVISGHKAYGVHAVGATGWTTPGQVGYRNTNTIGIPKGDNPETEYMIADGTYFNGSCCFDFGNAEMKAVAGGYGTMEAIYFGNCSWWDKGDGNGPWIMADLEVGVYNMGGPGNYSDANKNGNKTNSNDVSLPYKFVTAYLKGNSKDATNDGPFTLKGGNAQSGTLTTMWDGAFPVGYSPMNRMGGIVLGIGGDNSSTACGNFFEGIIASGFASTATDNAIQANIVAAEYGNGISAMQYSLANGAPRACPFEVRYIPSAASAVIGYTLTCARRVSIDVFNQQGRRIAVIVNGTVPAGRHEAVWDASGVPAGVYVCRTAIDGKKGWSERIVIGR